MATEQPPDGSGRRPRRGWWVAAGLLALLLVVGLVVLAVRGWVQWWWLACGACGAVLVVLWATGWLHRELRRPRMRELVGATMVAGLVVLWVKAPDLYTTRGAEKSAVAAATATTRAGILTLGAAIVAGLVAWVSLAETRRANAETQRANREADQRDRYAKAIEQLGSSQLDVRLGGIYGLERIAETSDQELAERDQRTVVEVLSAYVRQHTNPTRRRRQPLPATVQDKTWPQPAFEFDVQKGAITVLHRWQPPPADVQDKAPPRLAVDVQAAVTVLGRLPLRHGVSRGDLTGAQLAAADFGEANLTGAQLIKADLTGARLDRAVLIGARLIEANLTGARLGIQKSRPGTGKANLARALRGDLAALADTWFDIRSSDLTGAQLGRANLTGALLTGVNLTDAQLSEAKLTCAWLDVSHLSGANLAGADLSGATLAGADLSGATLAVSHLSGATLAVSHLSGANLAGADLSGAWLAGADLATAKSLTQQQLDSARGDDRTKLPTGQGLQRPVHWSAGWVTPLAADE